MLAYLEKQLGHNDLLCWLLRVLLFVSWLLIPAKGYDFYQLAAASVPPSDSIRILDPRSDNKLWFGYLKVLNRHIHEAERLGDGYGPDNYFKALRHLDDWAAAHHSKVSPDTLEPLMRLNSINIQARRFSWQDVERAQKRYGYYRQCAEVTPAEYRAFFQTVGGYLLSLYLWTLPFIFLTYLLRILPEGSPEQTFRQDGWEAVWAVLLWPVFYSNYPFNIFRRALAEAELRREGALFRPLRQAERETVQTVSASAGQFNVWRIARRLLPTERSLAVAFMATMLCWVFLPLLLVRTAQAETEQPRWASDQHCSQTAFSSAQHQLDHPPIADSPPAALPPIPPTPDRAQPLRWHLVRRIGVVRFLTRAVEHVPLFSFGWPITAVDNQRRRDHAYVVHHARPVRFHHRLVGQPG